MRHSPVPAFLERTLGRLVTPGLEDDSRLKSRHLVFLAIHLGLGFGALALVPIILSLDVNTDPQHRSFVILTLCTMGLYALAGLSLAVQPRLNRALCASAAITGCLIAWVAVWTGGASAPVWGAMALAPATAGLSREPFYIRLTGVMSALLLIVTSLLTNGVPHMANLVPWAPAGFGLLAVGLVTVLSNLGERMTRTDLADLRVRLAETSKVAALSSDLVTFHDRRGDVMSATTAACSVLGTDADHLQGSGLYDRIHPGDRPLYLLAMADAVNGRARDLELRILSGEGSNHMRTLAASFTPGALVDPECTAAVVVRLSDMSERKSLEMQVSTLQERQAQAPALIVSFLNRLSHDFRSPLNAVIGFSDMLAQEVFGRLQTDRQREYVRLINNAGQQLLDMIDQSADFAKLETNSYELVEERVPTSSIITAALEQAIPRAATMGVSIEPQVAANLPEIVTDRRALRHMVEALIWHASKKVSSGATIRFQAVVDSGQLTLAVSDTRAAAARLDGADAPTLPYELARRFTERLGGVFSAENDLRGTPQLVIRLPLGRPASRIETMPNRTKDLATSRLVS